MAASPLVHPPGRVPSRTHLTYPLSTDPRSPASRPSDDVASAGSGLSSDVERLLRSVGRARPPADLRARLMAAYERGDVPHVREPRGLLLRLVPYAAAAAIVAAIGIAATTGGGGSGSGGAPEHGSRGGGPLASWRVVDDPTLGFGAVRERATDLAFAGFVEGP